MRNPVDITQGHVDPYPCNCTGDGDTCYVVRHPAISPPPSYPTQEEADEVLRKVRSGELTQRDLYPNMRD